MPYNHFNQYRKALRKLQQPVIIKALRKVGLEEIQISIMQSLWEAITNGPPNQEQDNSACSVHFHLIQCCKLLLNRRQKLKKENSTGRSQASLVGRQAPVLKDSQDTTRKPSNRISIFSKTAGYKINI